MHAFAERFEEKQSSPIGAIDSEHIRTRNVVPSAKSASKTRVYSWSPFLSCALRHQGALRGKLGGEVFGKGFPSCGVISGPPDRATRCGGCPRSH